jgi:hypothetical protein
MKPSTLQVQTLGLDFEPSFQQTKKEVLLLFLVWTAGGLALGL